MKIYIHHYLQDDLLEALQSIDSHKISTQYVAYCDNLLLGATYVGN
ncbi:MAG: hypothetical protein ACPGVB_15590 [Chitinophagales bacterium]